MIIVFHKILLFLALGMILSSVSETMFYQVDITFEYYMFFIIYGLYGYLMMLLNHYYKISSFAGLFISASIFGFLIEGAFVGILYESLPFSLVWTSLAWHTLITVLLFWYYFRKTMLGVSLKNKILYNSFLGVLLGLWGTYSWSGREDDLSGEVTFDWVVPEEYISQIVIGYVVFVFGHMLYERTVYTMKNIHKKELYFIWGVVFLSFVIGNGIIFFPFSLVLLPLIYLCIYYLRKDTTSSHIITHEIDIKNIPCIQYLISLLIPLMAGGVYYLFYIYKIEFEMNVLYFVVGGIISVYLFFKSLWQLGKNAA